MSLSSSTLSAIQKAGSTVFAANVKLKNTVKEYAERVNAAIAHNPYDSGNNSLFENWKLVARLSQTLAGVEEELKKVYRVAAELSADDLPTAKEVSGRSAPTSSVEPSVAGQHDLTATDIVIKPKKKASKVKTRASASATTSMGARGQKDETATPVLAKPKKKTAPSKAKVNATKRASSPGKTLELGGNPTKLLQHLERVLNSNEFIEVSQTAIGQETGIPLGSMTAATKKLLETGRIEAGPNGSFKLANPQPPVTA